MKNLILIILFAFCGNAFAQNSSLVGKWKTVEVSGEGFSVGRNDSITLYDSYERTKVSKQNQKAYIRTGYAHNVFVFTEKGGFSFYTSDNPRSITFVGKYSAENGIILLKVKNLANIELDKRATYRFENGELYLKMHAEGKHPIDYVLRKVEE